VEGHVIKGREGEDDSKVSYFEVLDFSLYWDIVELFLTDKIGNEQKNVLCFVDYLVQFWCCRCFGGPIPIRIPPSGSHRGQIVSSESISEVVVED